MAETRSIAIVYYCSAFVLKHELTQFMDEPSSSCDHAVPRNNQADRGKCQVNAVPRRSLSVVFAKTADDWLNDGPPRLRNGTAACRMDRPRHLPTGPLADSCGDRPPSPARGPEKYYLNVSENKPSARKLLRTFCIHENAFDITQNALMPQLLGEFSADSQRGLSLP